MGYIMPVENYQYQQYHNRVRQEKSDPFPIERLYPIQLGMHDRKRRTKEAFKKVNMTVVCRNQQEQTGIDSMLYAEVTGKGGNFEATV